MTFTANERRREPSASAPDSRILWVLQVIAALGFAMAALAKLRGDPQVVETFDALGWGPPVRLLLAFLELCGAVALFVPRLVGLSALAFVGLTVGAITVQLVTGGSIAMALVLLVISAVVAWGRRRDVAELWAELVTRRTGS